MRFFVRANDRKDNTGLRKVFQRPTCTHRHDGEKKG